MSDLLARTDVEIALGAVNELLTDDDHVSHATKEALSRDERDHRK